MATAANSPVSWQLNRAARDSRVELSDEHFPLVLARVEGKLEARQLLELIRFFDAAHERAGREGRQLVAIIDTSEAGVPTSLVREMLADWMGDRRARRVQSFVIAPSPLIRGIVASLKWATGRNKDVAVVSDVRSAVEGARDHLRMLGELVPELLRAS